jgi:hypothetical protein
MMNRKFAEKAASEIVFFATVKRELREQKRKIVYKNSIQFRNAFDCLVYVDSVSIKFCYCLYDGRGNDGE